MYIFKQKFKKFPVKELGNIFPKSVILKLIIEFKDGEFRIMKKEVNINEIEISDGISTQSEINIEKIGIEDENTHVNLTGVYIHLLDKTWDIRGDITLHIVPLNEKELMNECNRIIQLFENAGFEVHSFLGRKFFPNPDAWREREKLKKEKK